MARTTAALTQVVTGVRPSSRPRSEFDSGINTSNAWTVSIERGDLALSDEDGASISSPSLSPTSESSYENWKGKGKNDTIKQAPSRQHTAVDASVVGRPARAIYDFHGKPEFEELTVSAGDVLHVIKQDLPDGWSLVKLNILLAIRRSITNMADLDGWSL